MNAAREFGRKRLIYHAVTFQPGLSFEDVRHNINAEVSLSARPVPGMALMLVRFVQNLEALRRESLGQLLCDEIGGSHAAPLRRGQFGGQWSELCLILRSSLEGVTPISA